MSFLFKTSLLKIICGENERVWLESILMICSVIWLLKHFITEVLYEVQHDLSIFLFRLKVLKCVYGRTIIRDQSKYVIIPDRNRLLQVPRGLSCNSIQPCCNKPALL